MSSVATELPATSVPGRVGAIAGPLDDKVGAIAAAPNGVLAGVYPALTVYLSYQPSRNARPRVPLNRLNISSAGVASLSISIFSAARARTAKI